MEVKKSCRRDQRHWREEKSKEAQEAADKNDSKTLYRIVRELTGAKSSTTVPIKSKDGRDLKSEKEQAERWIEHFREVLNQPTPTDLFDFSGEPTQIQVDITDGEITQQEVRRAISKLKNNKAAGLDGITAELLKHGKELVADQFTQLFNLIWGKEEVPAEWGQGVIVTLPKRATSAIVIIGMASPYCLPQGRYSAVFC